MTDISSPSLQQASRNRAPLEATREVAPVGLVIEPVEIGGLPFYDADLDALGDPPPVGRLKTAIAGADALLIVTPEYNFSLPSVLKPSLRGGPAQHRRAFARLGAGAPQRGRRGAGDRRGRDVTGTARRNVVLFDRAGETST